MALEPNNDNLELPRISRRAQYRQIAPNNARRVAPRAAPQAPQSRQPANTAANKRPDAANNAQIHAEPAFWVPRSVHPENSAKNRRTNSNTPASTVAGRRQNRPAPKTVPPAISPLASGTGIASLAESLDITCYPNYPPYCGSSCCELPVGPTATALYPKPGVKK